MALACSFCCLAAGLKETRGVRDFLLAAGTSTSMSENISSNAASKFSCSKILLFGPDPDRSVFGDFDLGVMVGPCLVLDSALCGVVASGPTDGALASETVEADLLRIGAYEDAGALFVGFVRASMDSLVASGRGSSTCGRLAAGSSSNSAPGM
jgi:hypothetical protein